MFSQSAALYKNMLNLKICGKLTETVRPQSQLEFRVVCNYSLI